MLEFYHIGKRVFYAECGIVPARASNVVFILLSDVEFNLAGSQVTATVDPEQPPYDLDFVSNDVVTIRVAVTDIRPLPN